MTQTIIDQLLKIKPKTGLSGGGYNQGYGDAIDYAVKAVERFEAELSDYLETYYLVVEFIETDLDHWVKHVDVPYSYIQKEYTQGGMGRKWEIAKEWTTEFQNLHKDNNWEDGNWFDTVEEFLIEKNKI